MILSSNLVWLDDIAKLWAFEVEGSKWQNRQYHTLSSFSCFLHWTFHLVRLWRVETSKARLPIPSCHFTMLPQSWCIDFLGFNKIGLAEQFCRLAQPRFRVDLFRFLSVSRSLERVGKQSEASSRETAWRDG